MRCVNRFVDKTSSLLAELKACSGSRNLERVKRIHKGAIQSGDSSTACIANTLISMYGKCGSLKEAHKVFDSMKTPNVVSWTALILACADNGESEIAIQLFAEMKLQGCNANARSFVAVLKACTCCALEEEEGNNLLVKQTGKVLHLLVSSSGFDSDTYVNNILVDMYAKFGSIDLSRKVFDEMQNPDVVSWTALIMGYADNGECTTALDLFSRMANQGCMPNARTFLAALKSCSDLAEFDRLMYRNVGKVLHLLASSNGCDTNTYVENTLVDMYSKLGIMQEAFRIFQGMQEHTLVSWNAVILGYADNGEGEQALDLMGCERFRECFLPNSKTYIAGLKACIEIAVKEQETAAKRRGKALHLLMSTSCSDTSVYVGNTLIDMYVKCGSIGAARRVFQRMQNVTVVSWTALILGYADKREGDTCLHLFVQMGLEGCPPDARTFVAALKGCTEITVEEHMNKQVECHERGKVIHLLASSSGCDSDIYVENTLVDMYAKCGSMSNAIVVFDRMLYHDIVSWNALILGYADNGDAPVVLDMFKRMKREGSEPNEITYVAALKACSRLGALEFGNAVYVEMHKACSLEDNAVLASCAVEFYAKCGNLVQAEQVFESHATKDLATWNALLTGYGRHGDTEGVFSLFNKMLDNGIKPDDITFSCILTACSHSGLVEKASSCFETMLTRYGVSPAVEHYTCMIDILGRANKLDSAMLLLRNMVCNADTVTWMAILGACRKWQNVELGRLAFESLNRLDDTCSGAYVLMANT